MSTTTQFEKVDTIRKQIAFFKAGIDAGARFNETQLNWLKNAEKSLFWEDVIWENATNILGRTPRDQEEAQLTVRHYNRSQCAMSR